MVVKPPQRWINIASSTLIYVAALLIRLPHIVDRAVPFGFDHGKDSLAILSILITGKPALIGPWTSIPGVHFGPAWYYLLLPGYALSRGDPYSAVITLLLLGLLQIALVHLIWGKRAALLFALAPLYVITSTSAWNPFPMTMLTTAILAISWLMEERQRASTLQIITLGLIAGLGFHFSAAFAIFYIPLLMLLSITILKRRWQLYGVMLLSFAVTFVPQVLFELRHDFIQTKSFVSYFVRGEPHQFGTAKIIEVVRATVGELALGLPGKPQTSSALPMLAYVLLLAIFCWYGYRWWIHARQSQRRWLTLTSIGFLVLPSMGYFFLHFNVWYVYGMVPMVTLLLCLSASAMPKRVFAVVALVLIIVAGSNTVSYLKDDFLHDHQSITMLRTKEALIKQIREDAGTMSFAVYTYVPDIYDFSYQYLWLRDGYLGKKMPTEFAYSADVPTYIPEKESLLGAFPRSSGAIHRIYYIVQSENQSALLTEWWLHQHAGQRNELPTAIAGVHIFVNNNE